MTAPIGTDLPGRCDRCGLEPSAMGHRSIAGTTITGCQDSGPLGSLLARQRMDGRAGLRESARAATEASTSDREWQTFVAAVRADAAAHDGLVSQNRVRDAIGHRWTTTNAKRRYSQLWSRARREGVLVETDAVEQSTDRAGGNAHRKVPLLRLTERATQAA